MDVVALTLMLRMLGASDSVLVVGYPLLVVASGLWSRERLVWLTAGMAAVGYATLWGEHVLTNGFQRNYYLNIVVVALLVTALVVSHQVRRLWSLGRFYENRPGQR